MDDIYYATAVPVAPPLPKKQREEQIFTLPKHDACQATLNGHEIKRLKEQGYTDGLALALSQNNLAFPLRIWIIDNSGSMVCMFCVYDSFFASVLETILELSPDV